jgi:protoheme ferro-lyase
LLALFGYQTLTLYAHLATIHSCTTSGSSYNHLWRELKRIDMEKQFKWSVLDRWNLHPTFIAAVVRRIELGLAEMPAEDRHKTIIQFSAHSVRFVFLVLLATFVFRLCIRTHSL